MEQNLLVISNCSGALEILFRWVIFEMVSLPLTICQIGWRSLFKTCFIFYESHQPRDYWETYQSGTRSSCPSYCNRSVSQIPQCTSLISHNAPFCNRNMHMSAHFCYKRGTVGYLSNALWDLWDGSIQLLTGRKECITTLLREIDYIAKVVWFFISSTFQQQTFETFEGHQILYMIALANVFPRSRNMTAVWCKGAIYMLWN